MSVTVQSNAAAIQARLKQERNDRTKRRARQYQALVKDDHRNAPRGGTALNMWGEHRSAPGEPPAMETGELFAKIDQGLERITNSEYRVTANYAVLEHGYNVGARTRISDRKGLAAGILAPRPLAQQAVAELRQQVDAE